MKRNLILAVVFMFALSCTAVFADTVVFDNVTGNGSGSTNETRSDNFGILAQIVVGGSNQTISGFGVYGNQVSNGNVAFAVFLADGTRLYNSGLIATSAGTGLNWYDSPTFTLTLNAGGTYYLGLISDQQFTYHWFYPGTPVNQGGFFSTGGNGGNNGNFRNASNPTLNDTCCVVQQGTRIFETTETPEPGSLALLGSGLLGLGGAIRRKLIA